jgi:hypothetical protein
MVEDTYYYADPFLLKIEAFELFYFPVEITLERHRVTSERHRGTIFKNNSWSFMSKVEKHEQSVGIPGCRVPDGRSHQNFIRTFTLSFSVTLPLRYYELTMIPLKYRCFATQLKFRDAT